MALERWHFMCKTCGHWKVAYVTRDEAERLVGSGDFAGARPVAEDDGTEDRGSDCPRPCGTP